MKPEELDERLSDTESVLTLHEKRINKLEEDKPGQPMVDLPDYSQEFKWIRHALLKTLNNEQTNNLKERLNTLAEQLQNQPKPVNNRYHYSLFPESDAAFYPKILFGKVIPWLMLFVIVGGVFALGQQSIEAWEANQYNQRAERCVRAWIYMNEHANPRVKKAMGKAWAETEEK